MKWFKLFSSLIILFFVVFALAIGSIMLIVNPKELQSILINVFQDQTEYELLIPGKLKWSFYPQLGLTADQVLIQSKDKKVLFDARHVTFNTNYSSQAKKSLEGEVYMQTLHYLGLSFNNVYFNFNWRAPVLDIRSYQAKLYQGDLNGSLTVKNLSKIPHWQYRISSKNVQLAPLLVDILEKDHQLKLSGLLTMNLQGETEGINHDTWVNRLNGDGDFQIQNGSLEGVDLDYFIKSAKEFILKDKITSLNLDNSHLTKFNEISATFSIHDGIVYTNNLLLSSPSIVLSAKGMIALLSQTIDFEIVMKPLLDDRLSFKIPLKVNGSLKQPEIVLDTLDLQKVLHSEQIKKAKKKALEKINQHLHLFKEFLKD